MVSLLITNGLVLLDHSLLRGFLKTGQRGFPASEFIVAIIASGIICGLLFIFVQNIRYWLITKGVFKHQMKDPASIWGVINKSADDEWAVVYLDDGWIYLGYIRYYKHNPDDSDQDFLLSDAKRVNDKLKEMHPVTGRCLSQYTKCKAD